MRRGSIRTRIEALEEIMARKTIDWSQIWDLTALMLKTVNGTNLNDRDEYITKMKEKIVIERYGRDQ